MTALRRFAGQRRGLIRAAVSVGVAGLLLFFVLRLIRTADLLETLSDISPGLAVLAGVAAFTFIVARAWRYRLLLSVERSKSGTLLALTFAAWAPRPAPTASCCRRRTGLREPPDAAGHGHAGGADRDRSAVFRAVRRHRPANFVGAGVVRAEHSHAIVRRPRPGPGRSGDHPALVDRRADADWVAAAGGAGHQPGRPPGRPAGVGAAGGAGLGLPAVPPAGPRRRVARGSRGSAGLSDPALLLSPPQGDGRGRALRTDNHRSMACLPIGRGLLSRFPPPGRAAASPVDIRLLQLHRIHPRRVPLDDVDHRLDQGVAEVVGLQSEAEELLLLGVVVMFLALDPRVGQVDDIRRQPVGGAGIAD